METIHYLNFSTDLQVEVHNVQAVQIFQTLKLDICEMCAKNPATSPANLTNLSHVEAAVRLEQLLVSNNLLEQLPALQMLHHNHHLLGSFKCLNEPARTELSKKKLTSQTAQL